MQDAPRYVLNVLDVLDVPDVLDVLDDTTPKYHQETTRMMHWDRVYHPMTPRGDPHHHDDDDGDDDEQQQQQQQRRTDGQTRVRLFWFAERDKNVFTTMLGLGLLLRLLPGFSSTVALCQYV